MTLQEQVTAALERIREGWCDPAKGIAIAETVIREGCNTCVEIGVFAGKSLIATAIGLSHQGKGVVYGIDSWQASDSLVDAVDDVARNWWSTIDIEDIYRQLLGNVAVSGVAKHICILRMTSFDASKVVSRPIDLLHVDGHHSEWSSTSDVVLWLPKVRPGGIVLMDDVNWPSTQTAIKFVEKWCDKIKTIEGKESTSSFYRKR